MLQSQNENYEKLLNNEDLSDFSFVCSDGEKIHVNKCIIAIQCPTFSAMLQAEMEESQTAEADIEDIDSETMLELLRFMYCGRVKDIGRIDDKLLGAANKYCIDELKQMAVSSIIGHIDTDNVIPLLEISELYGQDYLTECCVDFIKWYEHPHNWNFQILKLSDFQQIRSHQEVGHVAQPVDRVCAQHFGFFDKLSDNSCTESHSHTEFAFELNCVRKSRSASNSVIILM